MARGTQLGILSREAFLLTFEAFIAADSPSAL